MASIVPARLIACGAAVALAACGGDAPLDGAAMPEPRAVATGGLDADQLLAAVLDECQERLRGSLRNVACSIEPAQGPSLQAFAQLPDRLRVQRKDGVQLLLLDGKAHVFGDPKAVVPAADLAWLQAVRRLVDAAALGPLCRAAKVARAGADTLTLTQADGSQDTLQLRAGTLLPLWLRGPAGDVEFVAYGHVTTTWMPRRLRLAPLGLCEFRFVANDQQWDADFFDPRGLDAGAPAAVRTVTLGGNPDARPERPELAKERAAERVVLKDPGTWPERTAAYQRHHQELARQDQQFAGFPTYFRRDGQDLMAIGFRQRQGGKPFAAPPGWQIEPVPAATVLLVCPTTGDYAAKAAAGTAALQAELQARGLQPLGPIMVQPYFHLDEGEPPAAKLAAPVVRVFVPVQ